MSTRQDATRRDKTRQGKARQDKTRQEIRTQAGRQAGSPGILYITSFQTHTGAQVTLVSAWPANEHTLLVIRTHPGGSRAKSLPLSVPKLAEWGMGCAWSDEDLPSSVPQSHKHSQNEHKQDSLRVGSSKLNPDFRLASQPRCTRLQQVLHKSNQILN